MGLSTIGEATVLTALLTGRFVSLHTGDPGDDGADEVTGGSYARVAASFTQTGDNPRSAANNAIVESPVATAIWGTLTHFGIWTAATDGDFLGGDALTSSKEINIDDVARFLTGQLVITAD